MEIKKTPKADLQNKRSIFFLIGLVTAMGVVIGLFSMSQSEKEILMIDAPKTVFEQESVEASFENTPPPPEVKPQAFFSDIIDVVKDETTIEADLSFIDDFDLDNLGDLEIKTFTKAEEVVEEDIPVMFAEEYPTFRGKDLNEFRAWCGKNVEYPIIAQENGIQGRVTVQFVIEKDGKVSNVQVLRGVDKSIDQAAIKVVSSSPDWSPGKNRGKPVRFGYIMPIDFILQQ